MPHDQNGEKVFYFAIDTVKTAMELVNLRGNYQQNDEFGRKRKVHQAYNLKQTWTCLPIQKK